MYTAPEIVLMITAAGIVITNTITAWRNGAKLDSITEKTAIIEGHVNSKEAKYVEQLISKETEIELLKSIIVSKDKDKALLAQAALMRTRSQESVAPLMESPVQREIANNTAQTAEAVTEISKHQNE